MKLEPALNIERQASNIERRTSNVEQENTRPNPSSMLNVECWTLNVRHQSNRRAFSFAEVMFAVVILGIGFIMVAAVFPVAIRQTQSTGEENTATNAARTAAAAISNMRMIADNLVYYSTATSSEISQFPSETIANSPVFPPTIKNYIPGDPKATIPLPIAPPQVAVAPPAVMVPFTGQRWSQLQSNIVSSTDPRYSYVAFYKRENNSAVAELVVIAVANRNRANYDSSAASTSDISGPTSNQTVILAAPATLTGTGNAYTQIVPDKMTLSPGISIGNVSNVASPEGGTVTLPPAVHNPNDYTWYQNPKPMGRYYTLGRSLTAISAGTTITQFEVNPGDTWYLSPGTNGLWGTAGMTADPALLTTDSCTLTLPSTLQPTVAYVQQLIATPTNPAGQITLSVEAKSYYPYVNGNRFAPLAAAQGAFVIISDDCPYDYTTAGNDTIQNYTIPPNTAYYQCGKLNGRIFRLGAPVVQANDGTALTGTFLLDPAYGMQPSVTLPYPYTSGSPDTFPNPNTPALSTDPQQVNGMKPPVMTARCYIIGAGKDSTGNITGPAQDIGVFTTYFKVQ